MSLKTLLSPKAQVEHKDVVALLKLAGQAINALTPKHTTVDSQPPANVDERKKDFTAAASGYFNTLSSIDVKLQRQIKALEASGIIPGEGHANAPLKQTEVSGMISDTGSLNPAAALKQTGIRRNIITEGGLGNLDVGWLNSKNDNVGSEVDAEIWEEALRTIESFEEQKGRSIMHSPNTEDDPSQRSIERDSGDRMDQN